MAENFEEKFIHSPSQKQEKTENLETAPVQSGNPEIRKPLSNPQEVAPKSKVYIEERSLWAEFRGVDFDETGKEYKEPTLEQKERFKKRCERLSEIFENAEFQWYLDGATNISLYGDKQIRDHKDLDISVFREDLEKLYKLLAGQGFGIFVNYDENGRALMRKITLEELTTLESPYPDFSICKIGPDGKIDRETKDSFNFVCLHIHSKDTQGNIVISYTGMTLPERFFRPIKKILPNGKTINLSHPAIVAYHKLHSSRSYDLIDLQKLRPYLQKEDFKMLKRVLRKSLERQVEETEKRVRKILQDLWNYLTPILKLTHDQKLISEKLWEYPQVQKHKTNQKVQELVSSISQYISENPDLTFDDFLSRSLDILNLREQVEQKLKFIDELEKS